MNNENIIIEKTFPVNVSELFSAWTQEDALKSWWKPGGRKLESVQTDLQEGGTVVYTFEKNESSEGELIIEGKYETVEPENELVYTWNWSLNNEPIENGTYKLNVKFSEATEGAKLTVTQESLNEIEGIHPHQDGWEKSLDELADYLNTQTAN
jgi:uncharacterized protein YndB with AHSA1/START domain